MRYLVYKSTDLLDSILLSAGADCRYVRLTDAHLRSRLFNRLLSHAGSTGHFFPRLFRLLPGFSALRRVRSGDVLIVFDISNPVLTDYLRRCVPTGCSLHAFFWNPLAKMFASPDEAVGMLRRQGYALSTFDGGDAQAFGLQLRRQFIATLPLPQAPIDYDYYFVGASKGREALLRDLTTRLDSLGLKGKCVVARSSEEWISYRENIDNVARSRCLIELLQQGQQGITLRALEALVYRRKLITNCHDVASLDFYRPQNILVWDGQDADAMARFLATPMADVPADVSARYSLASWLSTFH